MRLTVLGCYGPFPAKGKACSGYLIESHGQSLLLDCGSGVVSNLRRFTEPEELCGIVLSHLHFDHVGDMGVMRYALEVNNARLPVLAPRSPEAVHEIFLECGSFFVSDAISDKDFRFGPFTVRMYPAVHPVETYSVRISDGETSLFYTGDTGIHNALIDYADNADTILADTCFWNSRESKSNAHMTVPEAVSVTQACGVQRLICSHLFGGIPVEKPELTAELSGLRYIEVAEQLKTYEI